MLEYLKAQNLTNELIIHNKISADELNRFAKSDKHWAKSRTLPLKKYKILKGEIYQFEFGKNYTPEMSYEHRGLVIGVKSKLLYVLPICTYDSQKHKNVYHPVDYPTTKSDFFLLKNSDFSFIAHDSVLKLNDIRTVSINRILYKQNGRIDPNSTTFKIIEASVLQKYFPEFYFEYENKDKTIFELNNEIQKLNEEIELLKSEIQKQKSESQSTS